MPDLSSWLSYIEASGHRVRGYLAVFTGNLVCTYTVDSTPTYPVKNLTVTVASGDASDILHNYRVTVESSGGAFKGELRVASDGTISTTNLPINEVSKGRIDIRATDVVKVYSVVYLNDKLVGNDALFLPDGRITYTDQLSNPAPLVCSGGVWAGFVEDGTTEALVYRYGTGSAVLDPDSGGDITHLWTLPTGVSFNTGTSASANLSLDVPVGEWLIAHTVTDDDNSKAWTQYTPVKVFDKDSNRPHDVMVESVEGDEEFGWRMQFRLLSSATLTDLPDGAMVAFFVDEHIGGANISLGAPDINTSAVKFVGYVKSDSQQLTARQNVISFEAISPSAKLNLLPGFTKVYLNDDTPDKWSEIKTLTSSRVIATILRWYTTWTDCLDLVLPTDIRTYPAFYLQKNTPHGQLKELSDGIDCRFICDRRGRGEVHLHPAYVKLSDRASITTTLTLTKKHIISAEIARQHWRTIDTFEARGFTDGALAEPIFSRYPGGAPSEGAQSVVAERLIAYDQEDLNERCGRRAALVDGAFIDADGIYRRAFELKLTLFGSFDVFDFYQEYIKLDTTDFGTGSNLRGVDLSDFRYWLKAVFVNYEQGTARVELTLQAETNAPEGSTYYPETGVILPPVDPPTFPPVETPGFPGGIPYGTGKMALFTVNGLAYTTTWNAVSPVWSYASWVSLSVSGTFLDWVPDGFNPGEGWVFTTTKIYHFVISTRVATEKHSWSATVQSVSADASISEEGFVCAVAYIHSTGTKAVATQDAFATLVSGGETTVSSNYATNGNIYNIFNGCHVSSKVAGRIITSAYTSDAVVGTGTPASAGFISSDHGATWGALSSPGMSTNAVVLAQQIHLPWHDNASENIMYHTRITAPIGDTNHRLIRSTGSTQTDISPTIGGLPYAPAPGARTLMATSVSNRQRMLMVAEKHDGVRAIFLSNDAGTTFATIADPGTSAKRCALAGDTANGGWVFGASNLVKQVSISGSTATFSDKAGDIADYTVGDIIAIAGW